MLGAERCAVETVKRFAYRATSRSSTRFPQCGPSSNATLKQFLNAKECSGVAYILDTNIASHLRDGDAATALGVAALDDAVLISIVTRVELEGGVYRDPADAGARRARLDVLLSAIPALAFDDAAASTYAKIVA